MNNPLLSTYSQGENRVTASILAVFERINTSTVEFILQALMEESSIQLIQFISQPREKDKESIPDGRISSSIDIYIETKIKPNNVNEVQIKKHMEYLEQDKEVKKLLILTPDIIKPDTIDKIKDERIFWNNFDTLIESIDSLLRSGELYLTQHEEYLLLELQNFIRLEELTNEGLEDRVLIIPAKEGIKEYKKYNVYMCQPNRSFKPSSYIAFYFDNHIDETIPKILGYVNSLNFKFNNIEKTEIKIVDNSINTNLLKERLRKLKDDLKKYDSTRLEQNNKFLILTAPENEKTIKLESKIENDKKSNNGKRRVAFVQNQRYCQLDNIKKAKTTKELENLEE